MTDTTRPDSPVRPNLDPGARSDAPLVERVLAPFRQFAHTQAASGIVLLAATVLLAGSAACRGGVAQGKRPGRADSSADDRMRSSREPIAHEPPLTETLSWTC